MIMGKFTSKHRWIRVFALLKFNEMKAQKQKKQMSPSETHNTSHYKPTLTACLAAPRPTNRLVCLNVTFTLKSKQIQTGIHTV